jgi:hypothetical protein
MLHDEGLLAPADVKRRRKKGNVSLRIIRWVQTKHMHAMVVTVCMCGEADI